MILPTGHKGRWSAEASALGWAIGEWKTFIEFNGRVFAQSEVVKCVDNPNEIAYVAYRNGDDRITVWND